MATTFNSTGTPKRKAAPAAPTLSQIMDRMFNPRYAPRGTAGQQAFVNRSLRYQPIFDALLQQRHENATQYDQTRKANSFSGLATSQGIQRIADSYLKNSAPLLAQSREAGGAQQIAAANAASSATDIGGMLSTLAANAYQGIDTQNQAARGEYLGKQETLRKNINSNIGQAGDYLLSQYGDAAKDLRGYRLQKSKAQKQQEYQNAQLRQHTTDNRIKLALGGIDPDTGQLNQIGQAKVEKAKPKPPKPRSGPGSLSPKDERQTVGDIQRAAHMIQTAPYGTVVDYNGRKVRLTPAMALEMLRTGANPYNRQFDESVINAARSLAKNKGKGLGPWGVKNAQRAGIHVGGNFSIIR
jgi:hypothetical protein